MATKKSPRAKSKPKTLATKTLSRKHAGQVKGGHLAATGAHIKEVVIEVWRPGGDTVKK